MASPTKEAPTSSATAARTSATCKATMSKRPMRKATVTIPLRVLVSSQPLRIKESAIHPPIGSANPNMKKTTEA